uniref:Sec1 family domain-containing protein 2 n=1 Tax=Caenorhabditis tropicalis TaxID=1561998 RepID=A0A1I7TQA5_9PELO
MLRTLVKNQILDQILRPQNYDAKLGHRKFSVLILDKAAIEIVNSCLNMNEVFEEGVTLVEDLSKAREPMPSMDAIYIMAAIPESIDSLIADFTKKSKFSPENSYKTGHVYFLEPCNDDLFRKLAKSSAVRHLKTLKEIDLGFRPVESQIFTVNPGPIPMDMLKIADGIASLCSAMNINPVLRFHSDYAQSAEICYRIDQKLKETKTEGSDADLIVIDRSFDLISPLLHESTLQAMASDLTDFQNGIYRFKGNQAEIKEIPLDETDPIWLDLRHKHLAEVLTSVQKLTKELKQMHEASTQNKSAKDVQSTIRQLPVYLKKKAKAEAYLSLAEECREKYFKSLEKIILLEQDMAVEHTPEGCRITDSQAVGRLSAFIQPTIPTETRLRLILIFMLSIGRDKDEQFFQRLLHHTDIPADEYQLVLKMLRWRAKTQSSPFQRRRAPPVDERFPSSRWDPKIKNLIQEVQQKKLDEREFKVVGLKTEQRTAMSARYGGGLTGRPREKRKIIIFVVGGITYSEIKTAYEMSEKTNTTVILGSDAILTPARFLETLRHRQ